MFRSLLKCVCSLREMQPRVNCCNQTQMTTEAETTLSQPCDDTEEPASKTHTDDADTDGIDQYSDVFTADGTELAGTDVTDSQSQQPTTWVTSAEEDEEEGGGAEEMWDANTEDSTTICNFSLNDDDDDDDDELNSSDVDGRAQTSDLCQHTSDVIVSH